MANATKARSEPDLTGTAPAKSLGMPAMRSYLAATRNFASGEESPVGFFEQTLALFEEWEPRIGAYVCTNLPAARRILALITRATPHVSFRDPLRRQPSREGRAAMRSARIE